MLAEHWTGATDACHGDFSSEDEGAGPAGAEKQLEADLFWSKLNLLSSRTWMVRLEMRSVIPAETIL